MVTETFPPAVARRPRAFVRVAGPDAEQFLQKLLSNDVAALGPSEACDALLLTPKARVIAPVKVLRRDERDFLLLTEPELGGTLRGQLLRFRFAAKVEVEDEEHDSHILLGATCVDENGFLTVANDDYGVPALEVIDGQRPDGVREVSDAELEHLRIEAGTPRFGKEIDDRVLPAEAGLVERAVSFTKGCYPGQEPIARLHYRGHTNRSLRVLEIEGDELPPYDADVRLGDKVVGRVTSATCTPDGRTIGLAYVRSDVPEEALLAVGSVTARMRPA